MKKAFPWVLLAACLLYVLSGFRPPSGKDGVLASVGRLPVLQGGRVKPLDTVARNALMSLRGKQSVTSPAGRLEPVAWLLDQVADPGSADELKVFRIDDPDVLGLLGKRAERGRYWSLGELGGGLHELEAQAERAHRVEPAFQTRFEKAVVTLYDRIGIYFRLRRTLALAERGSSAAVIAELEAALKAGGKKGPAPKLMELAQRFGMLAEQSYFLPLLPAADEAPEAWTSVGAALLDAAGGAPLRPGVREYAALLDAHRGRDLAGVEAAARALAALAEARVPGAARKASREAFFNRLAPFSKGMALYVVVLLLASFSWLGWKPTLRDSAFWVLSLAFLLHTAGLLARMVLEGRPPVTNLYSSAVFVGWGGVLLALALERLFRLGIGSAVGAALGFCSLLIAHHLSMSGDTMEMMQAVLDSNFWLATHVITITIGYSSVFLAGALAHVYLFGRVLGRSDAPLRKALTQMTYGILCFALLFTFIGTVLGGIWADQSWGRFWGWDPKENGALLILLWVAIILHARRAGLVREKGLMVMAVFGNIVTALSWFGVNMLGIGLHSYGFMDQAALWLAVFTSSQVVVMALALLPEGRGPK
ncbi:MAG: hypothetical protein A2X36_00675 [Elusimicrobia bacterium GWA2_69_24]|nr:MAG: hypothetical protein A2X36_00675 [Elusimicrobia bacterium GWA2_69_24]